MREPWRVLSRPATDLLLAVMHDCQFLAIHPPVKLNILTFLPPCPKGLHAAVPGCQSARARRNSLSRATAHWTEINGHSGRHRSTVEVFLCLDVRRMPGLPIQE